ncbi:hypothetical protein BCR35DRAFT_308783 [Leucosporidium creatinivorum]|uniref:Uncharacterized protein n=1 Tax=Leucosporidium creatinivorum TaxID=106004 RepID=A0A1Y2DYU6_9BASI|nr:hypothetical protein BCR35DRAFT_308783 [Leucosporidium creatinivorum]
MLSLTRSAAVRQLARRASPTSTRSFALGSTSTSRASACPVTPALRAAVTATLLVSFVYLASHEDALDQAVAPRSGLHYTAAHFTYSATTTTTSASTSTPSPSTSSPSFARLPNLSTTSSRVSFGGLGLHHELRIAGVFGRALGA